MNAESIESTLPTATDSGTSPLQPAATPNHCNLTPPGALLIDEDDVEVSPEELEIVMPPPKWRGTIIAKVEYIGRLPPIPFDDPRAEIDP